MGYDDDNLRAGETEAIDKLFLELSQFTNAKTTRELELEGEIVGLRDLLRRGLDIQGRTPKESLERWYQWSVKVKDRLRV